MGRLTVGLVVVCFGLVALPGAADSAQPDGQLPIAFDVSIAPSFFEPAETPGIGTPFVFLYAYGGHPDIDDLFRQQAQERDRKKREVLLHRMQRLMQARVLHAPIFEPATLHGIGPRVEEPAVGLNPLLYFAAPYEEMRLKKP